MQGQHLVKLALHLRNVVSKDGESVATLVHCPRQAKSIDALRCTGCARVRSLEWTPEDGGEIVCTGGEPAPRPTERERKMDFAEVAARSQLHEVVSKVTTCVSQDLSLPELRRLFEERDLRAVPVVDDDRR